jgi:hypothetical protein
MKILWYWRDDITNLLKFTERFHRVNISNNRNIFCTSDKMVQVVDLCFDMMEMNSSLNEMYQEGIDNLSCTQ